MYNDNRSEKQVVRVQAASRAHQERFGFSFGSSYALTKLVWFKEERPELFSQTNRFIHAADYLSGQLSGEFVYSDTSNALKTGYDLLESCWPDFIERDLGIPIRCLPDIVPVGTQIGVVCSQASEETGLPSGTPVFAGATDGTAAQFASGATMPGDWNSTLGTTLVFKGVTRNLIPDPLGRVYFHRHPEGWWLPGGASNTGTDWIMSDQPGADFNLLDQQAALCLPTQLLRYPLIKPGERFPFIRPDARGFVVGHPSSPTENYAAGMEGLAMIERLAYETLAAIGLEVGERVYLTGGGAKSKLWTRIRASVLQKTLIQPKITETAFGAAVIAANGCWYDSISKASQAMVHAAETTSPDSNWAAYYEARFAEFTTELRKRGYL
jgi:D-ribulokinase